MAEKDYYKTLGITKEANADEIKKAFRHLARKYHPDVNPGNKEAEDKFKEVNEAFQILGNPQKKEQYDRYGTSAFSQEDMSNFRGGGFNFDDLFSDFGFGDIFDIFNKRGRQRDYQEGADLRYDLEITLQEAFFGANKTIETPINEICKKCRGLGAEEKHIKECDKCKGTGEIRMIRNQGYTQFVTVGRCDKCGGVGRSASKHCDQCKGKGKNVKNQKVEIKIPRGINNGQYMRLEGKGEPGFNAEDGDLYVVVHIKEHPDFKREEENLFMEKKIDLSIAIFGGEIEVEGIDHKKIKIKIPSGTQSQTPFRIEGHGMSILNSKERGDLYVRVNVDIPSAEKDKELQFKKIFG